MLSSMFMESMLLKFPNKSKSLKHVDSKQSVSMMQLLKFVTTLIVKIIEE